jgi:TonB-linked SusC/RagA family outer membrane protein
MKKTNYYYRFSINGRLKKTLLTMKLTLFTILVFTLQVSANIYSQSKTFDLSLKDVSVKDVFKAIEKQSEFRFFYNDELSDVNRLVSVDMKDLKVEEILTQLFDQTKVSYKVLDNNLIVISPTSLMTQQKTVTGVVTDATSGEVLPGVNILIKGTTQGTITDVNGKYSIEVQSQGTILVFSYVGYNAEEVEIGNRTFIDVSLVPDITSLEEIVVIGYGSLKKSDLTGSVSSVETEDLQKSSVTSVGQAMQGRAAGVQIESAGGNPGAGVRVLIRGTGTLSNNNPLYILDGVQVDNIDNIVPSDIASMNILKDASAAAIYGSRAANGVVLITTKSGKRGENKIEFNAYAGVQKLIKQLDVLNASEWATVNNAAYTAAGQTPLAIANPAEPYGAGTDWQKEIFRTGPIQNYNLSASGGGDNYSYSISGGYIDQDGIVKKTNYNRWNFRVKSDLTKGRVKVGESIILSKEYWRNMAGGWGGQGGNPVGSAIKMIPIYNVYDETAVGGYGGAYGPVTNIANPVAQLNLDIPEDRSTKVIINAYAEVSLIKDLKYKFNVGFTNTNGYFSEYVYPYTVVPFSNPETDLSERRSQSDYFLQEHTLNYDKALGKHHIQALAGYTYQSSKYRVLSGSKSSMPVGVQVLDAGYLYTASGSSANQNVLISYLGRLVYSYDNKYVLTGTFRRDGSSRFSKKNRYGDFPSIALAWNVSNEKFFEPLQSVVNMFKIRASYGELGNQEINDYRYIETITPNSNYAIGTPTKLWAGAIQTALANPLIKWESSTTSNIGADFVFLKNKLSVTADYFIRKNKDILLQVPIPLSTGATGTLPYVNAGQISNKGIEIGLTYSNTISNDLNFQLIGTFTSVNNKVDRLGTGTQQIYGGQPVHQGNQATVTQAGYPVGSFYLIKADGIFNSQEEVNAHNKNGNLIQPQAKPGDIRFIDKNDDGKIDQNDRQYMGSPTPKFSFGFGGNINWKGFDLNIYFQGTYKNKIYNGLRQDLEGMNININWAKSTLDAWTSDNHSDIPRAIITDPNGNDQTSSRFLEDGSYLRFKTLQLGYAIPQGLLSHLKVSSCRIYISMDNLVTFTKYTGLNPDLGRTGSILDRGVDFGHVAYPLSRTSMVGVQVTF